MEHRTGDPPAQSVTRLLLDWSGGDESALEHLMPLVYEELRTLAGRNLRRERSGHTLQATALVHEAYLKLVDQRRVRWKDRAHFFAIAARIMRRILVDHARRRDAAKRGRGTPTVSLQAAQGDVCGERPVDFDVMLLDEALNRLAVIDPRQVRIVELRFFGGLTVEETAEVLRLSPTTVKNEWSLARAWLFRELQAQA